MSKPVTNPLGKYLAEIKSKKEGTLPENERLTEEQSDDEWTEELISYRKTMKKITGPVEF